MKCDKCTEKCPQEELACEIAKGRMYATKEVIELQKELESLKKKLAVYEDLQEMIGIPFEEHAALCREHIPDDAKYPSKAIVLTDDDVDKWHQYKDAEEQGLLLRLPCKVGDRVYVLNKVKREIYPSRVEHIEYVVNTNVDFSMTKIKGEMFCVFFDDFGKLLFLTQAEAEQALKQIGE